MAQKCHDFARKNTKKLLTFAKNCSILCFNRSKKSPGESVRIAVCISWDFISLESGLESFFRG